jgi:hypothetical protein
MMACIGSGSASAAVKWQEDPVRLLKARQVGLDVSSRYDPRTYTDIQGCATKKASDPINVVWVKRSRPFVRSRLSDLPNWFDILIGSFNPLDSARGRQGIRELRPTKKDPNHYVCNVGDRGVAWAKRSRLDYVVKVLGFLFPMKYPIVNLPAVLTPGSTFFMEGYSQTVIEEADPSEILRHYGSRYHFRLWETSGTYPTDGSVIPFTASAAHYDFVCARAKNHVVPTFNGPRDWLAGKKEDGTWAKGQKGPWADALKVPTNQFLEQWRKPSHDAAKKSKCNAQRHDDGRTLIISNQAPPQG